MKQVLVAVPCRERHRKMLEEAGQGLCSFSFISEDTPVEERQAAILDAQIIIGEPRKRELKNVSRLEWVQMTWAGTDVYTKKPGFPHSVKLTNMSGAFGGIISEYVIGGLLSLYHHFPAYHEKQKAHQWQDCGGERTIEDKRVLILGTGDIGEHVAARLRPFGAERIGIRRVIRDKQENFDAVFTMSSLDEQLPLADVVIGCLPNTPATAHLLNKKRLLSMKKDAVLINVGRGSLIVTDDLVEVLGQGHLFGAVLDVTEPEPLPEGHPMWDFENVIVTPHIAGPSFDHCPETEDKIYKICCENLERYLAGRPLLNEVDWETGYRKG